MPTQADRSSIDSIGSLLVWMLNHLINMILMHPGGGGEQLRPVSTIVADINALSATDRDQAIKDITQERTDRDRKRTELAAKQDAQADPALQAVFDPMLQESSRVISQMDFVLDGLFVTIAGAETPASLKA